MSKAVTIRAQAVDGTWETLGADRRYGVVPESVSLESDTWGSTRASFDLHRDPRVTYPDLGAFTPIEVEEAGRLIWSGRVIETPATGDRLLSVSCEGWQYHLDDDIYVKSYIKTSISEWSDVRTFLNADLGGFLTAPQVNSDNGVIVFSYPENVVLVNTSQVGIGIDLGPFFAGGAIWTDMDFFNSSGNTNIHYQIIGNPSNVANVGGVGNVLIHDVGISTGPSQYQALGTIPADCRYLVIKMFSGVGANFTPTAGTYIRMKQIRVFANAAYHSSGTSVLKASTVAVDAIANATRLLSSDQSLVQSTTFSIPSLDLGPQTPRQAWSAVDAYHNWMKKIDVYRRPVYAPLPSTPTLDYGSWSGGDINDASMNSGREIYNRALVTGSEVDGAPVMTYRGSGGVVTNPIDPAIVWVPDPTLTQANPGFEVNTTGWAIDTFGTLVRDTGVAQASAASLRLTTDASVSEAWVTTTLTGLVPGMRYKASIAVRPNATLSAQSRIEVRYASSPWSASRGLTDTTMFPGGFAVGTFKDAFIDFTANATSLVLRVKLGIAATSSIAGYLDNLRVERAYAPLLDRRGVIRTMTLPLGSTMPLSALQPPDNSPQSTIGDIWVKDHATTPFKGSITVTGDASVRETLTGQDVPAGVLLTRTGEMVRLMDRIDPDTGGLGRDARIVAVSYAPASGVSQVTLDNARDNLSALLSRMAVVVDNTVAAAPS